MRLMHLATLQLETPRLLLRPTSREDFDAWAAFMADPESARFIGGVQARRTIRGSVKRIPPNYARATAFGRSCTQ